MMIQPCQLACAMGLLALAPLAIADDVPPSAPASAAADANSPAPPAATDASNQVGEHVPPRLDLEHSPPLDRYDPRAVRRKAEEHSTRVFVCVSETGQLTAATLDRSSGSKALDEAAMKWAADARYFPATDNGQAVAACASVRVRFQAHSATQPP